MALGVIDEHLDRVEAHRLRVDESGHELGRIEELEECRLVGGPRKSGRMALVEAEAGEPGHLAEQLLRHLGREAAAAHAAVDEARMQLLHLLLRPPRAHGPAKAIRIGGTEAGHIDGDLHHLLLVEDHAQRLGQDGLERRVQVGHRLDALPASQVGMHGVALDGPGADDGHLDHQVVERLRPALGQGLHLRP